MHLVDASVTNEPGALKLTIKKFYRPSGASTQLKGVVPDVILPSVANESKDIGESSLDYALKWDEIPSARYERLNLVQPYKSKPCGAVPPNASPRTKNIATSARTLNALSSTRRTRPSRLTNECASRKPRT